MKKFILPSLLLLSLFSCTKKKGCTDATAINYDSAAQVNDNSCKYSVNLKEFDVEISFKQTFGSIPVSYSDFSKMIFKNENQDSLSITRLRYLLSDIILNKKDGGSDTILSVPQLINLSKPLSLKATGKCFEGTYKSISLTYGLDETNNKKNYPELNVASLPWPDMLGGGYHFMQMEGLFKLKGTTTTNSYALHNGTARKSEGVFEANHIKTTIPFTTNLNLNSNYNIELIMDIAEWYKNPYKWDFAVYSRPLMGNYNAQKKMHENASSVFKIGKLTKK